jgi:hypothetical protein
MLRKGFASSSFGLFVFGNIFLSPLTLQAQVNGAGQRPYLGWSSFSEQTLYSSFLTQANIQMQHFRVFTPRAMMYRATLNPTFIRT